MKSKDEELTEIFNALEGAHWLSGTYAERIEKLIEERESAIEGKHPAQIARNTNLQDQINDLSAFVKRLVYAIRKSKIDNDVCDLAIIYLRQHGLFNSPFRSEE